LPRSYRAPRVPKMTEDDAAVIAAIDAFAAAHPKHSWAASRAYGEGSYYRIGTLNVLQSRWQRIISERGVAMAEHYAEISRGLRERRLHPCLIKSRFGETKVVRHFGGAVKWCDSEEARAFYQSQYEQSLQAIVGRVNDGDLKDAVATKRQLQRAGEFF
jgi:hypothetical protein